MTHSWCGKFRRPEGLAPGNSHVPLKGELLYVYEGLTTYLGDVLAVRSGLAAGDVFREYVADVAAALDQAPGRAWRPLQDTAIAAQILYPASPSGAGARRGVDFYPEGFLIWLDADTLIREQTGGKRSLDDFCRTFLGGPSGLTDPPVVSTYTFADLVAALNAVAPRDWAGFLRERLDRVGGGAPLDGLVRSGWRLAYGEAPNTSLKDAERQDKTLDLRFSLGLLLKEDGEVIDALPAQAGAIAGLGPGMKLVAVNGRRFTPGRMHEAIHQARGTGRIELLVENDEDFKAVTLAYRDGERYPHLERIPGTADGLAGITAPRR